MRATSATRAAACVLAALTLLFAGCSHLPKVRWPFGAKPVPAPQAVDEILFAAPDGAAVTAFPQYWKRNTLVIDMQSAGASGQVSMSPRSDGGWPVRLALRVQAGGFGQVEVRGAQRVVLPISAQAAGVIDLELAPSVYQRTTPTITLQWGPLAAPTAGAPVEAVPAPAP
jgi:hypothetical protein